MINSVKPADIKEYITSEKFIWDDLLDRAGKSVTTLRRMWKKKHKLPSMILSWPAGAVTDDKGVELDVVSLTVPADITLSKAIRDMVERTKPYALLVCDASKSDVIKVFMESHHGVRTWTIPVRRHGDVLVLEEESYKDNEECLGVLWRKKAASG